MKQITIVTPVREGLVADISTQLANAGINIEDLDAFAVRDWDIVHLSVSDYDMALQVLRDAGYDAVTEDAVVVNVRDEPGSLAHLTQRLFDGGMDIRSVRILHRQAGEAMVAISMADPEKGMPLIEDLLVSRSM